MVRLAIRRVAYSSHDYKFESPELPDGLVIIEGENRAGKTTFADLIYFGLGGRVPHFRADHTERHVQVTSDTSAIVSLDVVIDGQDYRLRRALASNDILVVPKEGNAIVFPIVRSALNKETFSDWILQKLNIHVVTLYRGTYSGKLNFTDLLRLIYHNQDLDPGDIYKKLDRENSFVSDSREFRKAIFEVLVGRVSQQYYDALALYRALDQELTEAQAVAHGLQTSSDDAESGLNSIHLNKRRAEYEEQLDRLKRQRIVLQKSPSLSVPERDIVSVRKSLVERELEVAEMERKAEGLRRELARLLDTRDDIASDIDRVRKIIKAHETLSLFSPDTCPCCLRPLQRPMGSCICGAEVKEEDFQRFFYNADEYIAIMKTKQKNMQTLKTAYDDIVAALHSLGEAKARAESEIDVQREKLEGWLTDAEEGVYSTSAQLIDDQIVEVRVALERVGRLLEIELRREVAAKKVENLRARRDDAKRRAENLENAAETELVERVREFDGIYAELMRQTAIECRTAFLGPNYMPIVDEGEYREASASVAKRLMYYLTLFRLSVLHPQDVPFPRFLLIDTPETAGIDADQIRRAIEKAADVLPTNLQEEPAQIILTTGPGRYPPSLSTNVVLRITKENKLLRPAVSS